MAVPKRKMSRSNTRNRRAQWKAKLVQLNTVRVNGREITVPRRLVKAYKTGLLEPRVPSRAEWSVLARGCSSMVEPLPSKQIARVRFPSPAR